MKTRHIGIIVLLVLINGVGFAMLYNGITIAYFSDGKRYTTKLKKAVAALPMPQQLRVVNEKVLQADRGVKSVVLDPQDSLLYALNLEAMSVFEYDVNTKEKVRTLQFEATPGKGYNYRKRVWYNAQQEKPVEGCFTHEGNYLWISLHNAKGVVAWDRTSNQSFQNGMKKAFVESRNATDTVGMHFFSTGKTPKVMATSPNNDFLFVTNWHDNTVSVIDIRAKNPSGWQVIETLKTGAVPRGLAVNHKDSTLYVGNMGSTTINAYRYRGIKSTTFQQDTSLSVGFTPRHLVYRQPYLYATLSSPEKLLKIDMDTYRTVAEVKTADDPRTVALSPNGTLLFVVCYAEDKLQVFRSHDLQKLGSWNAKGKPVGVAVRQVGDTVYEAWVCNYTAKTLKVFSFEQSLKK